jgi:hypothetical protein
LRQAAGQAELSRILPNKPPHIHAPTMAGYTL